MFTVVGERINTSRKNILKAVENKDEDYIRNDAVKQERSGASYIDINAGTQIGKEKEAFSWLMDIVQRATSTPLCLDSPDPDVLMSAYKNIKQKPMINSISLEESRFAPMISFLKGKDCKIVALCMSDNGMPATSREVIERAGKLIESLESIGVKRDDIYIDPLIQPIGTDFLKGLMAMEALIQIRKEYPGAHFMCGLSNISFGLPERRIINRHFLALMIGAGLDGAILDPLDDKLMTTLRISQMLIGNDEYCMNFLKCFREGKIHP